jgi:hypothetical protein
VATITLGSNPYTLITPPALPGFSAIDMSMMDAVAVVPSPFVPSQVQTQTWPGADAWALRLTLPRVNRRTAAPWRGFMAAMRGMQNVVQLGDPLGALPAGQPQGAPVASNCVATLTVNAGGSYTVAPSVALSGGGGSGATATASLSGTSVVLTLVNRGTGYTSNPTVVFSGGTGSGAAATAQISNTLNATQLYTRGWTPNIRGHLLQGDYLQIGYRLHMVADSQVNSDASGVAGIWIFPSLRDVPSDGETISMVNCAGVFRLASNLRKWSTDVTQLTDIPLAFTEVR